MGKIYGLNFGLLTFIGDIGVLQIIMNTNIVDHTYKKSYMRIFRRSIYEKIFNIKIQTLSPPDL